MPLQLAIGPQAVVQQIKLAQAYDTVQIDSTVTAAVTLNQLLADLVLAVAGLYECSFHISAMNIADVIEVQWTNSVPTIKKNFARWNGTAASSNVLGTAGVFYVQAVAGDHLRLQCTAAGGGNPASGMVSARRIAP